VAPQIVMWHTAMATMMSRRIYCPQMPSKCCHGTCKVVAGQVYADAVSVQLVHTVCAAADKLVVNTCSSQAHWPGH